MSQLGYYIKKIYQKDNYSFTIDWSDGNTINYRLCDLQRQCPCAGCVDENTGKRIVDPAFISSDLTALRLISVGRYALRIQFKTGCSNGIYSYDFLRGYNR